MKKTTVSIITIACLMVMSLSTFALSRMQVAELVRIQNEKDAADTHAQSPASVSTSDVMENSDEVGDSCKIQDEQTLNSNDFTVRITETDQNQISELPVPLPDGRIFLRANASAEDPIPYIPTENPKTPSGIPIVPPELES